MPGHHVAGFLLAVLPLVATPGASLALLTQRIAQHGTRQVVPVIVGTTTGLFVHAALAAAGLSALVMRSGQAFTVVRLAGAAYLVALGAWTWRAAPRRARSPVLRRSTYCQALLGNVLNVKAASIYLTLVPQFVDPRRGIASQIFVLAAAHALLIAVWLAGWSAVLARAIRSLRSSRFALGTRRLTAAVLVALGLRAAST